MKEKRRNNQGSIIKLQGHRKSPYIAYTPLSDGKRSLGCFKTYADAEEALSFELMSESEKFENLRTNVTFEEIYEKVREDAITSGVSNASLNGMRTAFNHLQELHNTPFININIEDIEKYKEEIVAVSTLKHIKALINKMCEYAISKGYIQYNFSKDFKLNNTNTISSRKINLLTKDEIHILNDKFLKGYEYEKQYALTFIIMLYTGLKCGELINLKVKDIDLENKILTVNTNGKERVIPIHEIIIPLLNLITINRDLEEYVVMNNRILDTTYKMMVINKALNMLIDSHTTSDIRETFIQQAVECGVDIVKLNKILGKKVDKISEKYVDFSVESLRKEINKVRY